MTALSALAPTPSLLVKGDRQRQDSVCAALDALPGDIGHVFIHDCARPLNLPEQLVALHKIVRRDIQFRRQPSNIQRQIFLGCKRSGSGSRYSKPFSTTYVPINNAGVYINEYILTQDRYEMTFGVNYLAPFL